MLQLITSGTYNILNQQHKAAYAHAHASRHANRAAKTIILVTFWVGVIAYSTFKRVEKSQYTTTSLYALGFGQTQLELP